MGSTNVAVRAMVWPLMSLWAVSSPRVLGPETIGRFKTEVEVDGAASPAQVD